MAANQRQNEIIAEPDGSDIEWPELVSRAVNDLSRIVHAEIRLAELGIKNLIETEIERSLKIVLALGFLLCAAICGVGAAVIGLHLVLGLWWAAFAVVAGASGLAGIGLFLLAKRPTSATST
jgi:hypothetical protein